MHSAEHGATHLAMLGGAQIPPNYALFVRCITKFCIFFPFLNFALEVQNNRYFIDNRLMVGQKLTGVGPVKREREREVKPPPSRILEFSQG